jgi:hypothetical protein
MIKKLPFLILLMAFVCQLAQAQHSVARQWNEALLQSIREDFARPPVQARNLFHVSMAMYDAWAAYDTMAQTYLLGKTVGNYTCPFNGVPAPADVNAAREKAMSYAAYRLLLVRFQYSPNAFMAIFRFQTLMASLGYSININSTNYQSGDPAALGNYIAQCVIQYGLQDGSNESGNHANQFYQPVNPPMVMSNPGVPTLLDPNRWQPLTLSNAIDQNGNPIPATQVFQSPEWGLVQPFSLTSDDLTVYSRNGNTYRVYHDPGPMPFLDTIAGDSTSDEYKWNFELVSAWSAHLDPTDGVLWDISPNSLGNVQSIPQTLAEYHDFYDFTNGADPGIGHDINPRTGQPYSPQIVPRGDYTRVLAQFWADGPSSETPPGHWFSILNYVTDHPDFIKKFNGAGPVLGDLEWDIKAYFTLGGAVHDAAVAAWGIKGWYDGTRPITALRYMAKLGQSSDPGLPRYHPAGITLIPGLIELVEAGDTLAGMNNINVGKIKLKAWRGNVVITNPMTQTAGVGWVLAERWEPYQRKTFVTPPFAGYISGHSTYSRTAAETLTRLTGDEYFPGGMGEFHIAANSNFLGLEKGPSVDVTLQWATYRDASDQTSLSRIWGGIHPPFDDIPGRLIGIKIGNEAFELARTYFYRDQDADGFYNYEDCDDTNPAIYPGATETCDGIDNNCNGLTDDGIQVYTYYTDTDGDGFGDASDTGLDTCQATVPIGYVANNTDCDDTNPDIHPGAAETCDGIDNNCNGLTDDDIPVYTYFTDTDGDGFGDAGDTGLDTCQATAPIGFVENNTDCDDTNPDIHPGAAETCDGVDNNCNGLTDDGIPVYTYFTDTDGDGFGDAAHTGLDTCQATAPIGFVENNTDCDDTNPDIHPGAAETCDGIDNNCNGLTDDGIPVYTYFTDTDGDGFGDAGDAGLDTCQATAPIGYVANNTDCDDTNPDIHPGAAETCDGIDNNCNGLTDDDIPVFTYFPDLDADGFGDGTAPLDTCLNEVPPGYVTNGFDCNDQDESLNPDALELCDGLDNDCNGLPDDGLVFFLYFLDSDGDGFGAGDALIPSCLDSPPAGASNNDQDCDDSNPLIYPGAVEMVDSVDNNCNGVIDIDGVKTPSAFLNTSVFPNPVTDNLIIQHTVGETLNIEISNLAGQLQQLERLQFLSRNAEINVSGLLPGMYILKMRQVGNGQVWLVRVVKM